MTPCTPARTMGIHRGEVQERPDVYPARTHVTSDGWSVVIRRIICAEERLHSMACGLVDADWYVRSSLAWLWSERRRCGRKRSKLLRTRDCKMPCSLFEKLCTSPTRASRVTCWRRRVASLLFQVWK